MFAYSYAAANRLIFCSLFAFYIGVLAVGTVLFVQEHRYRSRRARVRRHVSAAGSNVVVLRPEPYDWHRDGAA